jgi:hypothetical protein
MDEKEQQLQKQNVAALYAIAEALQKQEDRSAAQDAEVALVKQSQELEVEKAQTVSDTQDLVKQISEAVLTNILKENMELNAGETRDETHGDVFYQEGGDEDKQVKAKDTNKTNEVQQTIHAGGSKALQLMKQEIVAELKKHMTKEHEALYSEDVEDAVEEKVMEEPVEEVLDMDVEPEGSSEYPMEEEEYDEDTFKMMKSLKKQMADMQKAIPEMVMQKAAELSEAQLLKSGFRKEQNKQPQVTKAMGLDESDYAISKSQDNPDFDINQVSFADLYNAKMARDSGTGTDGLSENFFRG